MESERNWGGQREGSGRKPGVKKAPARVQFSVSVLPETLKAIKAEASRLGLKEGKFLDEKFGPKIPKI